MLEFVRSKNFLIILLFILATCISVWLVSVPSPNIRHYMTDTHKAVMNNVKHVVMAQSSGTELNIDEVYLELLGFTRTPRLYTSDAELVVVSAATQGDYDEAVQLIHSVIRNLPNRHIVIYDMGLDSNDIVKLKKHCNETTSCLVKLFDFEKFPGHIQDMNTRSYKPIIIQESLNEYGAVFWSKSGSYFITDNISVVLKKAEVAGVAAWPTESSEPTSAHTHPKMFTFFGTQQKNYFFRHMIDTEHILLYNTELIHRELMLRWVACALTIDCIWPTGAQSAGCTIQRKPLYRYSGCHQYEASAFSIILGLLFDVDDSYTVDVKLFGVDKSENATRFT